MYLINLFLYFKYLYIIEVNLAISQVINDSQS